MTQLKMSEADFQTRVTDYLDLRKWKWFHDWDPRRNKAGFLDLMCTRGPRLLFAELKIPGEKLSPAQQRMIAALKPTGVEVHVWYPADWDQILDVLF